MHFLKMQNRKLIFALMLFGFIFSLSGCNLIPDGIIDAPEKVKLDTPTNVRVEEGTLRWNAVDNAAHYIIKIGDNDYQRNTIACDLKDIITMNGVYNISVQAVPSDTTMAASDYSAILQFTYEDGLYVQGNTTEGLFRYFDDINKSESYIGYGYDVINSSYVNSDEVKMNYPIFDYERLLDKRLVMIKERRTEDMYISSESMEDYMNRLSASFSTKIKAGKIFSGGAKASFTLTSTNVASALFYEYSHQTRAYYLILQIDTEEYKELLTDAFKRDLMNMNIANLFQKYGTHLITSVAMGGRIDLFYTMTSSKVTDFTQVKASLETDVKFTGGSVNVDGSFEYEDKAMESGIQIQIKSNVYGGNYSQMNTEKAMLKNYDTWINSIEEKPALIGIRDINSLYPIWELLGDSTEEQARKNEIIEYFDTYAEDSYTDLLSFYEISAPITPEGVEVSLYNSSSADVSIDPNDVSQGQLIYYRLDVTPGNAIITTTVTAENSPYVQINQGNRTIKISEDTPDGTVIKVTFSVGNGVSTTATLSVVRRHDISFDSQGGTTVDVIGNIKHNSYVLPPVNPIRDHYDFQGWYTDLSYKTQFVFSENIIDKDMMLYAKWTPKVYNISFDTDGGTPVTSKSTSIDSNFKIEAPVAPTKEGYQFLGWYKDQNISVDFTNDIFDKDCTLNAHWLINTFNVTFILNNNQPNVVVENVDYNTYVNPPSEVINGDLKLVGWFRDVLLTDQFDLHNNKITSNISLYAKWQNATSKISFNSNGGSIVTDIVQTPNAIIEAPSEPVRSGYVFKGWYTADDIQFVFHEMPNEDITLYAKWEINFATISFESNGGSSISEIVQMPNATISKPSDPTKEGYSFTGWYDEHEVEFIFDKMPVSNITLYAMWNANTYSIDVMVNNQTINDVQSFVFNQPYTIEQEIPTKEFYVFDGWFVNYNDSEHRLTDLSGSSSYTTWIVAEDCLIYPKWTNDPAWIQITRETDIEKIRLDLDAQYVLMNNVTLTTLQWTPITNFTGLLDGNGFQIFDLKIHIPADIYANEKDYGLFANNQGIIRNLTLSNATITSSVAHGGAWVNVGAFAGTNTGQILNSAVEVNINCRRYISRIGGFVGLNKGTISNVRSWTTIYGNGDMGAIAGVVDAGTISHATAYDRTLSLYVQISNRSIGSIVGYALNSTLEDIHATGMIIKYEGRSEIDWNEIAPNMGLLVGHLNTSTITGYSIVSSVFNLGNLLEKTNNGSIFNSWYNQQEYVGNGIEDTYGRGSGTVNVTK